MKIIFYITMYWAMVSVVCMVFSLLLAFLFFTIFVDREYQRIKATFKFVWFDIWMGAYYDEVTKTLYLCPAPMLCFIFEIVPKV